MGRFAFTEVHPFTIASVARNSGGEGVVLYVKSAGDWTRRLYDVARSYEASANPFEDQNEKGSRLEKGAGKGATMKMVVEGPYGGPGHTMYASYTSSFIVVGGSGITYGLSIVDELIRDNDKMQSRTRLIHLVWVVQDPSAVLPFLSTLTSFLDHVAYLPTISLKLTIHYTRAVSPSFSQQLKAIGGFPRHVKLEAGRPNLSEMLEAFVQKTDTLSRGKTGLSGVMVGVCGPKALADDVRKAERSISRQLRNSVGGVEVDEEVFGW